MRGECFCTSFFCVRNARRLLRRACAAQAARRARGSGHRRPVGRQHEVRSDRLCSRVVCRFRASEVDWVAAAGDVDSALRRRGTVATQPFTFGGDFCFCSNPAAGAAAEAQQRSGCGAQRRSGGCGAATACDVISMYSAGSLSPSSIQIDQPTDSGSCSK